MIINICGIMIIAGILLMVISFAQIRMADYNKKQIIDMAGMLLRKNWDGLENAGYKKPLKTLGAGIMLLFAGVLIGRWIQ